ncbi:MAG TPA: MFS transporter [Rhabdochlamydiaceae bacterium]|nr:MFS transporter [Rhabdochlamydiaceae bacterium]
MRLAVIFAVGFIMRPLGSILFGLIGDRKGRTIGLILSILCMTIPTMMIGLLPTYLQIGISAAVFLAILRMVQGIPIGGEIGGIMCYLTEVAPSNRKGFFGSWTFFGAQMGFVISSIEIYALESWMSPVIFEQWGWRLSFVLGGLIGIFGWYLRRRLHETTAYKLVHEHHHILKNPIANTFQNYKKQCLQTFCLSAIAAGAFYAIYFFSVIFLTEVLGYPYGKMLLINAAMLAISSFCLPFFGMMGDRFGHKRLLIASSIGVIVLPIFMFYFANQGQFMATMSIQFILNLFVTLNYALVPAFIAKLFPTAIRYTGIGISYNLANALMGGTAPLVSLYIIRAAGNNLAPAFYFILLGIVSLIPFFGKDTKLAEMK